MSKLQPAKAIAVDLDGCIAQQVEFHSTYKIGPPFPGAREFLQQLRDEGFRIIIHSARLNTIDGPDFTAPEPYVFYQARTVILKYLQDHDLPFDEVWAERGKPLAAAYVDDKAVRCAPSYPSYSFTRALEAVKDVLRQYVDPEDRREATQ